MPAFPVRASGLVLAALLNGCATRQVTPVRMVQLNDANLTCTELRQQIADNRAKAEVFLKKDKMVEQGNTARNIGSVIPMLGVLLVASTDLSNGEQIQARALIDRDQQLAFLEKGKGCLE